LLTFGAANGSSGGGSISPIGASSGAAGGVSPLGGGVSGVVPGVSSGGVPNGAVLGGVPSEGKPKISSGERSVLPPSSGVAGDVGVDGAGLVVGGPSSAPS
jgi:hypothetical protein